MTWKFPVAQWLGLCASTAVGMGLIPGQGFPDSSVSKDATCNARDPGSIWNHWRRDRPPSPVFLGFPCGSAGKESACNVGDLGSVPGLGRSPGEGKG